MKRDVKELKAAVMLVLAMNFMLFIYAPMELYFSNKKEFWFDASVLFPIMFKIFSLCVLISMAVFAILWLVHRWVYFAGIIVYTIVYVCTYLQGNFLVMGLPKLAGSPIFWDEYPNERIKCIVMWCVVTAAVVVIAALLKRKKFYNAVFWGSGFITLILLVTLVSVCTMTNGLQKKLPICVTDKGEFEVSTNKNFIILLFDSMDSRVMSPILEENQQYREALADFTYYPDTVGTYGYTQMSVPYILSGKWYENERTFEEYAAEAYTDSPLFDCLRKEGYDVGVYTEEMPMTDIAITIHDNVLESKKSFSSVKEFAGYWLRLVGYKYAPFDWKADCVFDQSKFNDLQTGGDNDIGFYEAYNETFYDYVRENELEVTDRNCFRFIHTEGAHAEPYIYDEDMNMVDFEDGTTEGLTKACITMAKTYCDRLKESGNYDNSVIVIMSDHGYQENDDPWGRWCPVLLVKGLNENHEFQISKAPISYEDLQQAFLRLLDGKPSTEIFDWKEGDVRERRYMYYEYEKDEHMYEAIKTGNAWEMEGMTFTGREYHRKN